MAKNRGKLNRIINSAKGIEKLAADPLRGHHRILVEYQNDPYPNRPEPSRVACQGCSKLWADLERENFTPPCPRPAAEVKIVVVYDDDPRAEIFDPLPNSEKMERNQELPESVHEPVFEKATEEQIIWFTDDELQKLSESELDDLISRIEKLRSKNE